MCISLFLTTPQKEPSGTTIKTPDKVARQGDGLRP